ncbi:Major facilitator superfamily domain general substrate transporter [Penicillium sp. DV-2018c]|nr:Major facilitator superfamily domain general substrate transporter [Penicillium sp. DV-2018c]
MIADQWEPDSQQYAREDYRLYYYPTRMNWTKPALGLRHEYPLVDRHDVEITKVIASGATRVVTVPSVPAAIGAAAAAQPEMAMPARNIGQTVGPRHIPKLRRRATRQAESAGTGQQKEPAAAILANHETMTVKTDAGIVIVIEPFLLGLNPRLPLRMELPRSAHPRFMRLKMIVTVDEKLTSSVWTEVDESQTDSESNPSALSRGSEGPHICEATCQTRTSVRSKAEHKMTKGSSEKCGDHRGLRRGIFSHPGNTSSALAFWNPIKNLRRFITQSVLSSAGGSVTVGMIADLWEPDSQQYAREDCRLNRYSTRMDSEAQIPPHHPEEVRVSHICEAMSSAISCPSLVSLVECCEVTSVDR